MFRKLLPILVLIVSLFGTGYSQVLYRLPQIANGAGVIKTTFVFFNNSSQQAVVTLTMNDDNGGPLPMDLGTGQVSHIQVITLGPGETRFLVSSGQGDIKTGSATVTSNVPVGVSAVFSIMGGGKVVTETGVGTSESASQFVIAVNTSTRFNTGIAIQNTAQQKGTFTFTLFNEAGQQTKQPVQREIAANGHLALFVDSSDGLFPGLGAFKGRMVVSSTVQFAALTLRQGRSGSPLTTLPAIPVTSDQKSFNLAQVANASVIKTQFVVFNLSAQAGSVSFDFTKSDGSPMSLKMAGGQTGSTMSFNVPGNGAVFFETDGQGSLSVGGGSVTSSVPVGVSAILSLLDAKGDITVEAGVGGTQPMTEFSLPVDLTQGYNTGIALFNNNASEAELEFEFRNTEGELASSASFRVAPNSLVGMGQMAKYTTELFDGLAPQQGQLAVKSTLPLGATGLRQQATLGLLTTLPVEEGVPGDSSSSGGSAILPETVKGVSIPKNTTWNQQLKSGFKLSGKVNLPEGYFSTGGVRATDGAGRAYHGTTFFSIAGAGLVTNYSVTVPSGIWDVRLCNLKADFGAGVASVQSEPAQMLPGGGFEYVSHVEPSISVFQDVTKDLTITAPTVVKVSGSISNMNRLPPAAQAMGAVLVFGADSSKTQAVTTVSETSTYETHLAPGQYSVGMFFGEGLDTDSDGIPDTYTSATSLFEIGTVTVGNSAVSKDFSVPNLVTLTGKLQQPQTTDYSEAAVLAADPRFSEGSAVGQCFPQVGVSFAMPNTTSGAYSMPLVASQAYDIFGSVSTEKIGGPEDGQFSSPLIGTNRKSFAVDSMLNIDVPAYPVPVTLSGKVTGPDGAALSGAFVTVTNFGNLLGVPTANFSASVQTNAQGNYSVKVPAGNSYTLDFEPPVEGGGFGF